MGRYYNGDIEGKFWFGIQSSTAADRFGTTGEMTHVSYYFASEDLPQIQEELTRIVKNLGGEDKLKAISDFFEEHNGYNDEMLKEHFGWNEAQIRFYLGEYADYLLGVQIKECLETNGECSFDAEL